MYDLLYLIPDANKNPTRDSSEFDNISNRKKLACLLARSLELLIVN